MLDNKARFGKWLDLILKMLDGQNHTVKELAEVLGTSERNLYYTFSSLKSCGFIVVRNHPYYYIDARSPFLQEILKSTDFTSREAMFIYGLMNAVDDADPMVGMIKRKLLRNYGLNELSDVRFQKRVYENQMKLSRAIKQKRCVILHEYSSPHSLTVSDRVVEPFLFLGDKTDVRAFEINSKVNKTFKVSRIGSVEIVDVPWFNMQYHKAVYTDMFMFSGEEQYHVKLRFDLLAHRIMLEEYPHSRGLMTQDGADHWIFEADLVSYVGIARFVLGLFSNVTVLEDDGLKAFLQQKINGMQL
jgi:predicted DNA-binding transcriptional regulator YafY